MNAVPIDYTDLDRPELIKILELADKLRLPPKEAIKVYLHTKAREALMPNSPTLLSINLTPTSTTEACA